MQPSEPTLRVEPLSGTTSRCRCVGGPVSVDLSECRRGGGSTADRECTMRTGPAREWSACCTLERAWHDCGVTSPQVGTTMDGGATRRRGGHPDHEEGAERHDTIRR